MLPLVTGTEPRSNLCLTLLEPSVEVSRGIYHSVRVRNACGIGSSDFSKDLLRRFTTAPREFFRGTRVWLKNTNSLRVGLIPSEAMDSTSEWCLKEKVVSNWWAWLVSMVVSVRGRNAFEQAAVLYRARVATPKPLAFVVRREWGQLHEYLLTESISDSTTLDRWINSHISDQSRSTPLMVRRAVSREMAAQLRNLHAANLDHRDLKPTNILVTSQCEFVKVWLIDLEGVWRWPKLPRSRAIQNIARLWAGLKLNANIHLTDAIRFLKFYLGPKEGVNWKNWARQIERQAQNKIGRMRRKQVPLPPQS